jgi:hypothetical protein
MAKYLGETGFLWLQVMILMAIQERAQGAETSNEVISKDGLWFYRGHLACSMARFGASLESLEAAGVS